MLFINMDKRFKISKMLIENCIFLLLLLIITTTHGGSADAFGFDSASSCTVSAKQSRRGRAKILIASIPCDLTHQTYCNLPGSAYPWHAVRRFVHENQGLMKRMYGDLRHIRVLRDEIRNNEIDVEDIEAAAERYSGVPGPRRASKYLHQSDEINDENDDMKKEELMAETKSNNTIVDDYKLAVETTTITNNITSENITKHSKKVDVIENVIAKPESIENSTKNELANETQYTNDDDRNLASNSVFELPALNTNEFISTPTNGDNIKIVDSPKLDIELERHIDSLTNLKANSTNTTTTSTTTTLTTLKSIVQTTKTFEHTASTTTMPTRRATTISHINVYRRRYQSINRHRLQQKGQQQQQQNPKVNTTILATKQHFNESERMNSSTSPPMSTLSSTTERTSSSRAPAPSNENLQTNNGNQSTTTIESFSAHENHQHEKAPSATFPNRQPSASKPSTTSHTTPSSTTAPKPPVLHDGQLFQDTVKQEPAPMPNVKGVNACPVKEEVVAPFWANNTRGEILALLNLYPFEQYVHWEKCTHENKQMYCRDGCRCEQEYRLHRLLAYDPHNECRGIFSDWFRFPSCCICKCYNIPIEFRATSRSPRMQSLPNDEETTNEPEDHPQHPLDIAEEQVRRAIYEHASEDWYRPRDDFDYYEED